MRRVRKLFSRPRNVRDAEERRRRLFGRSRIESRRRATRGCRTKTSARPDQSSRARRNVSLAFEKADQRRWLRSGRCRSQHKTFGGTERKRTDRRRYAFERQTRCTDGARRGTEQSRNDFEPADAGYRERNKSFDGRSLSSRRKQNW